MSAVQPLSALSIKELARLPTTGGREADFLTGEAIGADIERRVFFAGHQPLFELLREIVAAGRVGDIEEGLCSYLAEHLQESGIGGIPRPGTS